MYADICDFKVLYHGVAKLQAIMYDFDALKIQHSVFIVIYICITTEQHLLTDCLSDIKIPVSVRGSFLFQVRSVIQNNL